VSPNLVNPIKRRKLSDKNIETVEGTIDSFVKFLRANIGDGLTPRDVVFHISGRVASDGYSSALESSIEQIGTIKWLNKHRINNCGGIPRDFFSGFAPTWEVVANDISVTLAHDPVVFNDVSRFVGSSSYMLLVIGQSGSGKTTTLMKAALKLATDRSTSVFVLNEATKERINDIVKYVGTTSKKANSVLFINNIILFADELLEIEADARAAFCVVGLATLAKSRLLLASCKVF
jgi:ABC-type multidrug transport system fused ATPase/permease subunit